MRSKLQKILLLIFFVTLLPLGQVEAHPSVNASFYYAGYGIAVGYNPFLRGYYSYFPYSSLSYSSFPYYPYYGLGWGWRSGLWGNHYKPVEKPRLANLEQLTAMGEEKRLAYEKAILEKFHTPLGSTPQASPKQEAQEIFVPEIETKAPETPLSANPL